MPPMADSIRAERDSIQPAADFSVKKVVFTLKRGNKWRFVCAIIGTKAKVRR